MKASPKRNKESNWWDYEAFIGMFKLAIQIDSKQMALMRLVEIVVVIYGHEMWAQWNEWQKSKSLSKQGEYKY